MKKISFTLLFILLTLMVVSAQAQQSGVMINRRPLTLQQVVAIQQQSGTRIPPGRYWYDTYCGAWGREGEGTLGFTVPGLNFGPLPNNISNGTSGVHINGRQITYTELRSLQSMTGPVQRGSYWLDAQGNAGLVGGPALVNLRSLSQSAGSYRQGNGVGQNYSSGGGSYRNSNTGIGIITDGSGGATVFTR